MSNRQPITNELKFIGLCLAPFRPERAGMLREAAAQVEDWGRVYQLAFSRYVAPLVGFVLAEAGLENGVPAGIAENFRQLRLNNAASNSLRLSQCLAITSRLAANEVPLMYLKGASLVFAGDYPDCSLRMFGDIDLLSEPSQYRAVLEAFTAEGKFQTVSSDPKQAFDETLLINDWGSQIELHWRLDPLNGVEEGAADRRLRDHAVETEYLGKRTLMPSAEDRLIQCAVHGTAHHAFDSSFFFMMAADIAHILGNPAAVLDPARLRRDLGREKMLEHAAVALELTSGLTGSTPVRGFISELYRISPGLEAMVSPAARALTRVALRPGMVNFRPNMVLFSRVSIMDKLRFLVGHRVAYFFMTRQRRGKLAGNDKRDQVAVMNAFPGYRRGLFNLEVLRSHWELLKFYRRTRYIGHSCSSLVTGNRPSAEFGERNPE